MTGHSDNSNAFLLADGSEELSPTVMWTPPDAIHYVSATPVLTSSRYKLGELICYGGMGVVYAARDLHLDRDVAVKVLRLRPDRHPDAVRLYTREAKIISRLSHPGIVPIYDFGLCTDGRPYHVMKLVQGGTLSELISSADGNVSHLLTVFADVCQTMAFVHTQGIIHMDLKPSNVMVGAFGEVYVMDWGLARFQKSVGQDRPGLTIRLSSDLADFIPDDGYASHVGVCGTPGYMSPEQARGDAVDARADVFGLGAILCEILVGHAPYVGHDARQVYLNARRGSIDATMLGLEECDSDRALVRLARRCLTTDRNDRPASAVEVSAAVSTYQETALQRVESDMNRFFELSLDLFCIADFDGFFKRINENFSRVLGYQNGQLLSRPFLDYVHPEDQQQTVNQMSVLRLGQPVVRFRNRYRASDGHYVTLEWMAKAVESERIIFAVARDVTPPS